MKQSRQTTALLLTAVMLLSVSCGDTAAEEQTSAPAAESQTAAQTEPAESLSPEEQNALSLKEAVAALPEADYAGHEFGTLARDLQNNPVWYAYDIYASETNGDPINDAVFNRNQILEEHFNIKIVDKGTVAPGAEAKKRIAASDDSFDLVTEALMPLATMGTEGYFYNLFSLKELHLSEPWWD